MRPIRLYSRRGRQKARLGILRAVTALLFSAALAAGAYAGDDDAVARSNPHNYELKSQCQICHKENMRGLNFDAVTTCTKCHTGNVDNHPVVRHPMGKAPKTYVPSVLPLGDGKIVCFTCHEPHNKTKNPNMLRIEYMKLCETCHAGY